ncbi:YbaK/EbsC family protein [Haloarcula salina]|uniref:YbaK/EbsC family protein n=1 Tax=Haloarcula salina TaxID=1429914 RepID=A0AA41FZP2_9EURY|nr:YbaK/EbsC family protein [Haloarcula salina]MBV0900751.1 YbaK/EbsC family protein [Haloarcula salina]
MHPSAERFQQRVRDAHGLEIEIHEFAAGTKTAADAAAAVGCDVAQIASSIALRAGDDLVVVVTSGANRVSESRIADLEGADADAVEMADADEIKATLGWSIGGVPPLCHERSVPTYLDADLTTFETVWAAAGTPEAVFPIAPGRLVDVADPTVTSVAD